MALGQPDGKPGAAQTRLQASGAARSAEPATTGGQRGVPRVQTNALHQYQRAQVESASPTGLVVLLYEGAIRFCHMARSAMARRDLEAQNLNLIRSQRIVGELISSLDRGAGGEVAANLSNIYAHILEELVGANLYDSREKVDHVIALLTEMRASWVEIDRVASAEGGLTDAEPSLAPAQWSVGSPPMPGPGSVAPPSPARSRDVSPAARAATIAAHRTAASAPRQQVRLGDQVA